MEINHGRFYMPAEAEKQDGFYIQFIKNIAL